MVCSKIKTEQLSKAALIGLIAWCAYPVLSMVLNFFSVDVHINYNIWATIMYLDGGLGLALGLLYLYRIVSGSRQSTCDILKSLAPLWVILLFGIWAIICALAAKHSYAAFFGLTTMKDCITTWTAYLGFILLGLVLSQDRKKTVILCDVFVLISALLAIISLADTGLTRRLCVNDYTNCFHYQSVFYNTNHFSYYLAICIVLTAFLLIFTDKIIKKVACGLLFALFVVMLLKNDTLGSYLASLITLIFAFIWSFINGEKKRMRIELFVLLLLFAALSYLINLTDGNLASSLSMMISDAGVMNEAITGEADAAEFDQIGSLRGELWALYWDVMVKYPVMGVGPENVANSAHNNFLQIGAFLGIPGLVLYLLIFVIGAVRLFRNRKSISRTEQASAFIVVAYLICMVFGVTMFYTAPYFYAVLGFCLPGAMRLSSKSRKRKAGDVT